MAEPTRPEPMTWALSITISLQLRTGCRAPRIVLGRRAAACCSHGGCAEAARDPAWRLRLGGRRRPGPGLRLAAAQGEGAREAARARRRASAASRAGDGRALAGPRPGCRGEQPQPGRPRGAEGPRRRGDLRARRAAPARCGARRRRVRARRGRRAARANGPGLRARPRALRRRAAAREPLRRLGRAGARAAWRRCATSWSRCSATSAPCRGGAGFASRRAPSSAASTSSPSCGRCSGVPRLLTLAGTGGAGKTRLALELARSREDAHADGALLVELDSVAEGSDVPDAVAEALDLRALPGGALVDAIAADLAPRELLLVLDNCEHVIGASAALADALLRSAPRLTILATSREPLRVPGEVVFRVPSLAIPDPDAAEAPAALLGYEAVRLFVERAARGRARVPTRRVERSRGGPHLPPARRPAARARARGRPHRRARRRRARRAPRRPLPAPACRQPRRADAAADPRGDARLEPRAARALSSGVLLRRLAVFAGGFALEAAEEVCAGDGVEPTEVADLLARLVEKSLVATEERQRRRGATGCSRRSAPTRTPGSRRRANAKPSPLGTRPGSPALVERADSQLLGLDAGTGQPPRRARDAALPRPARRARPLRPRVAVLAPPHRAPGGAAAGSAGASSARRRRRRCGCGRCSATRRRVPLRPGDERLRRSARPTRRSRSRASSATPALEWRAIHFRGGIAIARDDGRRRCARATDAALALARRSRARGGRGRQRLLARRRRLGGGRPRSGRGAPAKRASRCSPALADRSETVPALLNVADIARAGSGRSRAAARLRGHAAAVRRGLVPRRRRLRRAQLGECRPRRRARRRAPGRSSTRRSPTSCEIGSERGRADVWARTANLALAEQHPARRRSCSSVARRLRGELGDRRGAALARVGLGHAALAAGEHARAERLLARGGRHVPPRRRPLGARLDALADVRARAGTRPHSTRRRRSSRRRWAWSRSRGASAGER